MVSRADSHTKSYGLLQSANTLSPPPLKQQNFFTNHQRWQISLQLDCETGLPIFHLRDSHGVSHTVTEFIVENLDPEFKEVLSRLASAEEQQKLIHEYLQRRLDQATPFKVHVGRQDGKLFVRFGDYGLKGGMQGVEANQSTLGKAGALLVSVSLVGLGICLTVRGGNSEKLGGGILISSGLSSGLYAYQTDGDKNQYEDKEYAKQATYGAVTGLITGAFGKLAEGANTIARIGWQTLGAAAGGATSTVVSEAVEYVDKEKKLKPQEMLSKAMHKATSGGIGAFMGALTNTVLTSEFVNQFMKEYSNDMTAGALWLKQTLESGMSSGSSMFATGFYENLQEVDSTKKKDLKTQAKEAVQSAFIAAVISGISGIGTYTEQKQKIQEHNQAKNEIEQIRKVFEEINAQTTNRESGRQDVQKMSEQFEQYLSDKLTVLKPQYTSSQEKNLQHHVEKDPKVIHEIWEPKVIHEIWEPTGTALQEFHAAQEAVMEALQKISQEAMETIDRKISRELAAILNKESGFTNLSAARQYLHPSNRRALKKALKADPVSYVEADCSLEELIPHVVLVHALNHQCPNESIAFEMIEKCNDEEERIVFYMQKVVSLDGSIGHHLQLKKIEFDKDLASRPHLHWTWNQLVQPNGDLLTDGTPLNSWEKSKIAFLEPLSTFENGIYYKPFGVTPYDTFTFNSHQFSDKSVLLIPQSLVDKVKMHLTGFRGRIVPYDDKEPLRSAVIDALQTHYPETWHICDAEGNLTGKTMQYSEGGFSSQTCIRKTDGKVIVLIENAGSDANTQHKSEAIKYWNKSQRFIGLHIHSVTFWIENPKNKYYEALKKFKNDHDTVKNHPLFAGSVKDIHALSHLGALTALDFYRKSSEYDLKTGIIEVANYIINEAIFADLVSLFYQMNPAASFNLSILELKIIFESTQLYLLNLLENIKTGIESSDPNQKQKAMHFFESDLSSSDVSYCSILKRSLIDIQKAKEEALRKLTKLEVEGAKSEKKAKPLCLLVAQDEWEKIETPAESIEFDLGKNWPYSDQLRKYANKVLRTLPTDLEKLQQLYQQLSSCSYREIRTPEERKEQYRLNIICNMIQWALQEKIYLMSRKEYNFNGSILANKLSKQIGVLAEYGLGTEDFTLNIGDCLFDNIVAQLPSSTLTSLQLRKELIQYMQKHSEVYLEKPDYQENELCVGDGGESLFFESWEQYLACMGQPQVWGTELEIQALASYLDSPIVLLTVGRQPKIYNSESKNPSLFLHHLNENHFEACIPLKGLTIDDVYNVIKNQPHF